MSTYLKIGKYLKKFKGSLRDPFCYLGIISVILFELIFFAFPKFLNNTEGSIFTAAIFPQLSQKGGEIFIEPTPKAWPESPELLLIKGNAILATTPPVTITPQVLGLWLGKEEDEPNREITEYTVKSGDSLWSIAQNFNISIETILWANDLKSLLIQPGQKLLILPVSGVIHLVKEGDTVSELAKKYETSPEKIIDFNGLSGDEDLVVNEVLIIPDGKLPSVSIVQKAPPLSRLSTNNFYGQSHAYPYGQCTWWVAQKRKIPAWGNAKDWLDNALRSGYPVCKGSWCIPQLGAVISLKTSNPLGHVGYVEGVKGDKVIFSEMNYLGWGRVNYRTLKIGSLSIRGYIY